MPRALSSLDYVVLTSARPEVLESFYTEILGLSVRRRWSSWVELAVGSTTLAIRPVDIPYALPEPQAPSRSVHLGFRVAPSEVADWHAHLVGEGVEVLCEPEDRDYGHRTFFSRDPDGNLVEIYAEL